MAGGRFDPGVSKVRPGTYTNFTDQNADIAGAGSGGGGTGGGGGGGAKPKDYTIGKIISVTASANTKNYGKDFTEASESVYCGAVV